MKTKSIKFIICFAIISFLSLKTTYAYSFGVPYVSTGDTSSSSAKEYKDGKQTNFRTTSEYTYNCTFQYKVNVSRKITINIYNSKGTWLNQTKLMPDDSVKFPAGTAIGLDIFEESWLSWEIKDIQVTRSGYECYSQKQRRNKHFYSKYSCTGKVWYYSEWNNYSTPELIKTVSEEKKCNTENSAPWNGECLTATWNTAKNKAIRQYRTHYYINPVTNEKTDEYKSECERIAYAKVAEEIEKKKYSSYTVEYYDPNDIKKAKAGTTSATIKGEKDQCKNIVVDKLNTSNIEFCKFNYNLEKTCIDRITGNITYNQNCDTNKEMAVKPTGNAKTVYFSPINSKSTDEFRLLLNTWQSNQILTKVQCDYIKKNNKTSWENLIVGPNDEMLTEENYNIIVKEPKKASDTACKIKTSIVFPIEQKFYGEEKKSEYTSLKGYGMYFRQIDINNPFPTDSVNSIYWNGLYDKNQNRIKLKVATDSKPKTIKLETGFNNPTYVAKITNEAVTKIKVFNSKHSYTSWTGINKSDTEGGMNVNGQSYFVRYGSTKSIFTTKAPTDSFYKLGCGPANANWNGCGNS